MKTIKITRLQPSQWKELKEIRLKALLSDPYAFKETYENAVQYSPEKWTEKLDNNRFYLVAYLGNNIIGMAGGAISKSNKDELIVLGVFIEKKHRGKGFGEKIMNSVLEETKRYSVKKIKLWVNQENASALNLYKKLGFILDGKDEYETSHGKHTSYVMYRDTSLT